MAKDLMGELGLDVESFNKAIDQVDGRLAGLQKSVDSTDKKIKGGLVAGLKDAAKWFVSAFGVQAVARYIGSLRNLGSEIEATRAKLLAGSEEAKNFDTIVGGAGAGSFLNFKKLGNLISNLGTGLKTSVGNDINRKAEIFKAIYTTFSSKGGIGAGAGKALENYTAAYNETERVNKELDSQRALEDEIASITAGTVNTQEEKVNLLNKEIELQRRRLALIESQPSLFDDPRAAANQAKVNLGGLLGEMEEINFAKAMELRAARAVTKEQELQMRGMSGAAKDVEIRAKYEAQILQALRNGKVLLADQLIIQKDMALARLAIEEHNMTPAQRRAERTAARKFARDAGKTVRHEADLEKRLQQAERQGSPITPGSELDRYRERMGRSAAARHNSLHRQFQPKSDDGKLLTHVASIDQKVTDMTKNK